MMTLTQLSRNDIENSLLTRGIQDEFGKYMESLGGAYSQTRFPRNQVDISPDNDPPWTEPMDNDAREIPLKYKL
jgi:hypothetical protein